MRHIVFFLLFFSLSAAVIAQDFEVTGIIFQKEPVAIVNGKIVKVGEEIDGAIVQKIFDKSVFLKYKGDLIIKNVSGKKLPKIDEVKAKERPKGEKPREKGVNIFLIIFLVIIAGIGFYLSGKKEQAATE